MERDLVLKEGKVYVPKDEEVVKIVEEMKKAGIRALRGEEW